MSFAFSRRGWVWIVSLFCLLWAGAGEAAHVDPVSTAAPPELGPITANGQSFLDALSRNGRWTAWHSLATNVLTGQSDSNNAYDVFLRDRRSGENVLVSHVPGDTDQTGNGHSSFMSLSADGAWGAFVSGATNLTTDNYVNPSAHSNILLYDRATGAVSLATRSAANPANEASGVSSLASISADGNFVAFHSTATNLVSGQVDPNGGYDVFLYDRVAGTVTLVSRTAASPTTTSSVASNQILPVPVSADGRYVAFTSDATDLVSGQVDTNGGRDVFLFDRVTGTTTLVSHAAGSATTAGDDACPDPEPVAMSADGRWIAFVSQASNLASGQVDPDGRPDVFLFDRVTGTTTLVSHAGSSSLTAGNGFAGWPSLSDDGRYLAYNSSSTDLGYIDFNDDYDIFLWDRDMGGGAVLVSHLAVSIQAADPNAYSYRGFVSGDGRYVLFHSYSTGIVEGQSDTSGTVDLFLFDRLSYDITLVSRASGTQTVAGNGSSGVSFPGISSDGSIVAFTSDASNLYVGEANATSDVFLFTLGEFYTAIPCRVLDTRESGPVLTSGTPRLVTVTGTCDIPTWARAVSLNVTVTEAGGAGHLTLHPGTQPLPGTSTINFSAGQTRANNAIILLSEGGRFIIMPAVGGSGTIHAIVDVNGYFE